MREETIRVSPFDFISLLEIKMEKQVGEHAKAFVKGHISEDAYNTSVKSFQENDNISIIAVDSNGNEITLLNGLAERISSIKRNDIRILELEITSYSVKLDIDRHVRTFQNRKMSYSDVAKIITAESEQDISIIVPHNSEKTIEHMLVQYKETDWEFFKRMASRMNTFAITDYKNYSPYISLGMVATPNPITLQPIELTERTEIKELLTNKGVPHYNAFAAKYYEFQSREIYDICDKLIIDSMELYIWKIESSFLGEQLEHFYTLKTKEGFLCKENYNMHLIGAELGGKVTEVEKEKVKVSIENDVNKRTYRWFDYATVYSSPDNIGWYFMPESGSQIRLCFPTEQEKDAYVASAVHEGNREDADIKSLRTHHGKEIVFAPDCIRISNGSSKITLDDSAGITIYSEKNINIKSEKDMRVESAGKILVSSNKQIEINQNESRIDIQGGTVDISARHVRTR